MLRNQARRREGIAGNLVEEICQISSPVQTITDLAPLVERIGDARFVLLGEASHGTSEYYQWHARLSLRLFEAKGFNFVSVEGDWPACYRVNRRFHPLESSYLKQPPP